MSRGWANGGKRKAFIVIDFRHHKIVKGFTDA
jgi:hypothetical protein